MSPNVKGMIAGLFVCFLLVSTTASASHFIYAYDFKDADDNYVQLNSGEAHFFEWDLGLTKDQRLDSLARVHLIYTINGADENDISVLSFTGESDGLAWRQNGNFDDQYGRAIGAKADNFMFNDFSDGHLKACFTYLFIPLTDNDYDNLTMELKKLYFSAEVTENVSQVPIPPSGLLLVSSLLTLTGFRKISPKNS